MAMWEIDTLLKSSVDLVKNSGLIFDERRHLIWNLENIPHNYQFDAGCFEPSEVDKNFDYKTINPYELGLQIMKIVSSQENKHLIYDWSAFLLNFYPYFEHLDTLEKIKSKYLEPMKKIYSNYSFDNYEPIHATLTIYNNGKEWFEEEQNELIKWFCS